ncbi:MAG: hypothetical protein E7401_00720 [Ruminococcaceae bacterium]|nr:hypothetical protein [Oscillospiraceae bacterium]
MIYNQIIDRVAWGEEFFFFYNSEKYWISQNELGLYLTRVKDSYTQSFNTAQELFENGLVDGKTIAEIWDCIEGYF